MKKILILGGSGFLSGTLSALALAIGYQVWAVTRGRKPLPHGIVSIEADRKDRAGFASAVEAAFLAVGQPWDLVVDCIGFEVEDVQQDINIFRQRANHLVFVSSDFVFDPAHRQFPQGEESTFYLSDGYGGKKRACELELMGNGYISNMAGNREPGVQPTGSMAWTIVRPCHIYGPGSQLGCLPLHGRDPQLIALLQARQPLKLVGGGHFLQQPVFAPDLARMILSCAGNTQTYGQIYMAAGPDIIESRQYYQIIAEELDVAMQIEEVPVAGYAAANPGHNSFLCHRIYDMSKARMDGLALPATPIEVGLRTHLHSLLPQK